MKKNSALLVLCARNSPVPVEVPSQGSVTWSFNVFFDLRLIKRLRKQSRRWWFKMPSRSLCRHCDAIVNAYLFHCFMRLVDLLVSLELFKLTCYNIVTTYWRISIRKSHAFTRICIATTTKPSSSKPVDMPQIKWCLMVNRSCGQRTSLAKMWWRLPSFSLCLRRMTHTSTN